MATAVGAPQVAAARAGVAAVVPSVVAATSAPNARPLLSAVHQVNVVVILKGIQRIYIVHRVGCNRRRLIGFFGVRKGKGHPRADKDTADHEH